MTTYSTGPVLAMSPPDEVASQERCKWLGARLLDEVMRQR
jgi:hypothetical protein